MAAQVKGKQISWGVYEELRDAVRQVSNGIVTAFSISNGGATTIQTDEQDDEVSRIDHAHESKVTIEVVCTADTDLPGKGDLLIIDELIVDGVDFTSGQLRCDDAKADYANASVKKFSVSGTYYPLVEDPV